MKYLILTIGLLISYSCASQSDFVILADESTFRTLTSTLKVLPSQATASELSVAELQTVKELMDKCITEYNSQTKKAFKERGENRYAKMYQVKKLRNYKIQYVPYINDQGDKEIWINGFCDDMKSNWRSEIVSVFDGGNCFFRIRLNLTTRKCLEIGTNGYA